jgi:heat shock protein HspQ
VRHGTLKLPPASFTSALAPATILVYVQTAMNKTRVAKYTLGQVVRHRLFPFRGVVFDIDPEFNNTEEWYQSIPAEVRPRKDQPFYHLFAENAESEYIAYVSEQNLLPDTSGEPVRHPQVAEVFETDEKGSYRPRNSMLN